MRAYKILPTAIIQAAELSQDALKRLTWMDWYGNHGENAELTCRHFGISKSVFYRWKNRFNKRNLKRADALCYRYLRLILSTPNISSL